MSEFNSNSFLIELDSFGKPPPPHKIFGDAEYRPAKEGGVTREIVNKLDNINIDKQKKLRTEIVAPSDRGMIRLGSGGHTSHKTRIAAEDAEKWRSAVLDSSRPKQANGMGQSSADSAKEYVRNLRNGSHYDSQNNSRSSSALSSLHEDAPPTLNNLKIQIDHERKSSDYSSASSHKSPSPPSQSSYSDYASLYKSASPSPRPPSPLRQFNDAFKGPNRVTVVDTEKQRYSVSPMRDDSSSRSDSPLKSSSSPFRGPSVSVGQTANRFSPVVADRASPMREEYKPRPPRIGGLTAQIRLTDKKPPVGKAPAFGSASQWSKITEPTERTPRWKEQPNQNLNDLKERLQNDLVFEKKHAVGTCAHCAKTMFDIEDRYSVNDKSYHSKCFACEVCGKELREQQFYCIEGRFYCKSDYLNEQLLEKKETRCARCKQPIKEMILSALNRNYHPTCFTCTDCNCCLEGISFSVDDLNQPYCLKDFYNRFAPKCSACRKTILPDPETGETIRMMMKDNSYHLECYVCEGCNISLAEGETRCYPLKGHLLCSNCHMQWSTQAAKTTDL